MDARKAEEFPVVTACRTADVSSSAFYEWAATVAAGPAAGLISATRAAPIPRRSGCVPLQGVRVGAPLDASESDNF